MRRTFIFLPFVLFLLLNPYTVFSESEMTHMELMEATNECKRFIVQRADSQNPMPMRYILETENIISFCTKEEIFRSLTPKEKTQFKKLSANLNKAKKNLSKEDLADLEEVNAYIQAKHEEENRKPLTPEEIKKLDIKLKKIWNEMRFALANNDIEKASSYFSNETREPYKKAFTSFPPEIRARIAKDLEDIRFVQEMGRSVEYDIRMIKDGKTYSYYLVFVKEINGEWKIRNY